MNLTKIEIHMPEELNAMSQDLVHRFAEAMAKKLYAAQLKYGYQASWSFPNWMPECREHMMNHIKKGDPLDVANYCAFLWHHSEPTWKKEEHPELKDSDGLSKEELRLFDKYNQLPKEDADIWRPISIQDDVIPFQKYMELMQSGAFDMDTMIKMRYCTDNEINQSPIDFSQCYPSWVTKVYIGSKW